MLELEIEDEHIGDALDLYDEVLKELGYTEDEDPSSAVGARLVPTGAGRSRLAVKG